MTSTFSLTKGYTPGSNPQDLYALLAKHRSVFNKNFAFHSGSLGTSASFKQEFIAPCKCKVTVAKATRHGAASGGSAVTAALSANGSNPLNATNIDIDALTTAGTPEAQTLSSTEANLILEEGESLVCTWTTDGSTSLAAGASLNVTAEPID